ncbi:MAG: ring-cleaving dioxygenase [Hyphomicrobiaceae bacterium]|nr:ring-cleaving dioxygenase [Hyphomicrobiaceae bacterium]
MTAPVNGLHHVTAIASNAQANLDFWTGTLGLRLVKKTVNFDDPGTYHLYYGDALGRPGTAMTFFPWEHLQQGRPGSGEASLTLFSVPPGSLDFWRQRLGGSPSLDGGMSEAFGEKRLIVADPDGTRLALVEREDAREGWTTDAIGTDVAIRGFHGVALTLRETGSTEALLTGLLGYRTEAREGSVTRLRAEGTEGARIVDLIEAPGLATGSQGAGSVHHVAFSTPDDESQRAVQVLLAGNGFAVTPVIDRDYFNAIYFRSPGGVLFEVATEEPGFAIDEDPEALGTALKLPRQHEPLRARIEAVLPPLFL